MPVALTANQVSPPKNNAQSTDQPAPAGGPGPPGGRAGKKSLEEMNQRSFFSSLERDDFSSIFLASGSESMSGFAASACSSAR